MSKINFKVLVASIILTLPALGFVTGFIGCSDCGWNIFGRVFIGFITAILATVGLGDPSFEYAGQSPSLRIYIIPTLIILYFLFSYVSKNWKEKWKENREGFKPVMNISPPEQIKQETGYLKKIFQKKTSAQWALDIAGWTLIAGIIVSFAFFFILPLIGPIGFFVLPIVGLVVMPLLTIPFVLFSVISVCLGIRGLAFPEERIKSIVSIVMSVFIFVLSGYFAWNLLPEAWHFLRGYPSATSRETEGRENNQNCETEEINDGLQVEIVLNRCANPTSQFLTINGKPQKSYYAVDKVSTSPDGKSVAYFAYKKTGPSAFKNFLVMNGKEYELISPVPQVIDADGVIQTDFTLNNIIFSSDSRHFAYTAYFKGGGDVYLDGKLFKSYRHQKVDEQAGRHCQFYDPVSELQFSPSNKLLYVLSKPVDSTYSNCDEAIIINGAEYDTYPSIGSIAISPDGTKIVYAGYEEGKPIKGTEFSQGNFYLVINKERFKTFSFPDEKIYDLRFSDNGQAICYTLGSPQSYSNEARIIVNNKEYKFPFERRQDYDFSSFCNSYSAQF